MIRYIFLCFGWCCGSSKEAKTTKHKDHQNVSVSLKIDSNIGELEVVQIKSNELKSENLLEVVGIHQCSPINKNTTSDILININELGTISEDNIIYLDSFSPTIICTSTSSNNLPRRRSVQDLLKDSGLTKPQLIRGYSYCDHAPGELIDINLDHGTCCRRHENGVIVTESIETLNCCLATIDENEN